MIRIRVSPGEFFDKLTILEIKLGQVRDPDKLRYVKAEFDELLQIRESEMPRSAELFQLTEQLAAVNRRLWNIEDEIRAFERAGAFGERFVELARSVYLENDRRAEFKRAINLLLGSDRCEVKQYAFDT